MHKFERGDIVVYNGALKCRVVKVYWRWRWAWHLRRQWALRVDFGANVPLRTFAVEDFTPYVPEKCDK